MPSSLVLPVQVRPAPPLIPDKLARLSDDECVQRLADAVAAPDTGDLDELARLLSRLAVVIE